MFIALRAAKWSRPSRRRAGQLALTHRQSTSPSARTSALEQRGALGGEDDLFGAARVLCVVDDGDDLGDDVAAALDLDEVADADAEARDLVGVVQRGAGDGGASDEHGSEDGDGSHLAGAADLEVHAFEARDGGARGELVGDGPARGAAGEAEAALLRGGVDFDHDAVDLVAERVAQAFGVGDEGENFVDGVDGGGVGVDAEACGAEGLESGGLRGEEGFAGSVLSHPSSKERWMDGAPGVVDGAPSVVDGAAESLPWRRK